MCFPWFPPVRAWTKFDLNNFLNFMSQIYTITAFAENKPGVLYRIADLFLRRKVNIESLTVSEQKEDNLARFTIVVVAEPALVEKIVKQLYRIIEITKVIEKTDDQLLIREIALFKVSAPTVQKRMEVEQLARLAKAEVISVRRDYLIVEKTGTEDEIEALHTLLTPLGIREFVQSGRIVIFT